jgi:aryl-alcohol dehydrogenase-like predicted oxidoreductase
MRFRPLGGSGMAVSAISLKLVDSHGRNTPQAWVQLIYSAFENGVNAFEVVGRQPALVEGFGQALQAVERRLVFVALRLGLAVSPAGATLRNFTPESLIVQLESFLSRTKLDYVDAVILDDPQVDELSPQALDGLKAMRESGRARMLGVAGHDSAIDAYISTRAFDLLCTPFSLISGWKERLRLKAAIERDMAVIGYDFYPEQFHGGAAPSQKKGLLGGGREHPLAGVGTYAFLDRTSKWTGEELCLAYALTEPSLATVQLVADRIERIETLAQVPERDLPAGVAAQIEMARFSPTGSAAKARRA